MRQRLRAALSSRVRAVSRETPPIHADGAPPDPPKFDFESYIANYEGATTCYPQSHPQTVDIIPWIIGRTRLERLYLIGTTSIYLSVDALHAAIAEAKQGKDVNFYTLLTDRLHSVAPEDPLGIPDVQWCERKAKEVKVELESLEQQLKQYKNNLIKESIRVSHLLFSFLVSLSDLCANRWAMTIWVSSIQTSEIIQPP